MSRTISLSFTVLGAFLAAGAAGIILIQQADMPGSSVFPMPFLVLFEWAVLGIAGAVYVSLAELRSDERQLQGAWAIVGAYIPLILLGAFSIGPIALVTAVLLLGPTIFLTIRHGSPILRQMGILAIGALANLVILLTLIGIDRIVR
jgi:hypothetical protein